jgi:hypothetical protein
MRMRGRLEIRVPIDVDATRVEVDLLHEIAFDEGNQPLAFALHHHHLVGGGIEQVRNAAEHDAFGVDDFQAFEVDWDADF